MPHTQKISRTLPWFLASACWLLLLSFRSAEPYDACSTLDPLPAVARAIAQGRLDLGRQPPAALLAQREPYEPEQHLQIAVCEGLFDLSYYKERFYAYWGLTPVFLLYLPYHLLTGHDLNAAVPLVLFLCAAMLAQIYVVRSTHKGDCPGYFALVLCLGGLFPYLAQIPTVYNLEVAGAMCFISVALALLSPPAPGVARLASSSLCLGLAVGCRPNQLPLCAILIAWCIYGLLKTRTWTGTRTAALIGPAALICVILGFLNFLRFDSFFEFGTSYQLANVNLSRQPLISYDAILAGLWNQLFTLPYFSITAPYNLLIVPPSYGFANPSFSGYQLQMFIGMLPLMPFFFIPPIMARFATRHNSSVCSGLVTPRILVLLGAVTLLINSAQSVATVQRYLGDYCFLFSLAACITNLSAGASPSTRTGGIFCRIWQIAIIWSFGLAAALSVLNVGTDFRFNIGGCRGVSSASSICADDAQRFGGA